MNDNENLTKYVFYDNKVEESFNKLGKEVLEFLDYFRKEYKNNNMNNQILIVKVKQTRLYFDSVMCQINDEYFDIFFSPKYINVEGKEKRLCYRKENGYILEDKTYQFDNGSCLSIQRHLPYNIALVFPNDQYYNIHLECDDNDIDKKIVEYFQNHLPSITRINELFKIFLSLINDDKYILEIKSDKDLVWFENGELKHYIERFKKDNIEYHIYLKDNEIHVEKTIIEKETIDKEDIIGIKKYQKVNNIN